MTDLTKPAVLSEDEIARIEASLAKRAEAEAITEAEIPSRKVNDER